MVRALLTAFAFLFVSFAGTALDDAAMLDLKNAKTPQADLITGGQPSMADLKALKAQGVTMVINLRAPGEVTKHDDPAVAAKFNFDEAALVRSLGMTYMSLPIASADDLTTQSAELLDAALGGADGKVLLHCGSGNRAGALMALRAYHISGMAPEAALEAGKAAGLTKLEPAVRARLGLEAMTDQ